jgi:hypothetical protein
MNLKVQIFLKTWVKFPLILKETKLERENIYSFDFKREVIRIGEKVFTHSKERVVKNKKLKFPPQNHVWKIY